MESDPVAVSLTATPKLALAAVASVPVAVSSTLANTETFEDTESVPVAVSLTADPNVAAADTASVPVAVSATVARKF